jgi:hypothetical protein
MIAVVIIHLPVTIRSSRNSEIEGVVADLVATMTVEIQLIPTQPFDTACRCARVNEWFVERGEQTFPTCDMVIRPTRPCRSLGILSPPSESRPIQNT